MTSPSKQNAVQARQRRAYAIVKRLAMESGHMRHERDVQGFEAWCEEFEKLNAPVAPSLCLPARQ